MAKDHNAVFIALCIHIVIFALIMYDIGLWYVKGLEHTITHVIRGWCKETPALPFIMGFVTCHLMGA